MKYSVSVDPAANEMAREEIAKQIAFLSRDIEGLCFSAEGDRIDFDGPPEIASEFLAEVQVLARRTAKSLRNLERTLFFGIPETPDFSEKPDLTGIHLVGNGQVVLEDVPLALYRYFDRVFERFGDPWRAKPLLTPTLISSNTLARCDYFRSFPQYVTFAGHLRGTVPAVQGFRTRHERAGELDSQVHSDLDQIDTCLSPAVCYHVYRMYENRIVPLSGTVHAVCGKCFRFEAQGMIDLRRLWEFTMRELVFLGGRQEVLAARSHSMEMMATFLQQHHLAGEIRTASDPFFVAPDATAKAYFQLRSDSKFEVSLLLHGGERTAAASHNYHSDFFGRIFRTELTLGGPMHSACVAFGLERWVYAFLTQHGTDPSCWPRVVQDAPEFVEIKGLRPNRKPETALYASTNTRSPAHAHAKPTRRNGRT